MQGETCLQETVYWAGNLMRCANLQGHFAAALRDAVEAVNARHCMGKAIATYSGLQRSPPEQVIAGTGRSAELKQNPARSTNGAESNMSEQTADIADLSSRASNLFIAQ